MTLLGKADAILCNDKHSTRSIVLVASDLNHSALISWQDLQKLRVILASFPAVAAVAQCFKDLKKKRTLSAFLSVFSDTLDNKPMCAQRMKIYLKDRIHDPRDRHLRGTGTKTLSHTYRKERNNIPRQLNN